MQRACSTCKAFSGHPSLLRHDGGPITARHQDCRDGRRANEHSPFSHIALAVYCRNTSPWRNREASSEGRVEGSPRSSPCAFPVSRRPRILGRSSITSLPLDGASRADMLSIRRRWLILRSIQPSLDSRAQLAGTIVEHIASHPELTSVESVCARFAMSPLALQRLFRHKIGVSPKSALQRYRLREAVEAWRRVVRRVTGRRGAAARLYRPGALLAGVQVVRRRVTGAVRSPTTGDFALKNPG